MIIQRVLQHLIVKHVLRERIPLLKVCKMLQIVLIAYLERILQK